MLGYTVAHSASILEGATTSSFEYTPQAASDGVGNLKFNNNNFEACPTSEEPVYQIYAAGVPGFQQTGCVGVCVWDC